MMEGSIRSLDTLNSSPPPSAPRSSGSSNEDDDPELQLGRPSNWTPSRRRKLTRLYLFSKLSTEEISTALREGDWTPGDESTKKIVSSLLNKQPRWLRPKNKEQIDQRVAGLSKSKIKRRAKRKLDISYKIEVQSSLGLSLFSPTAFDPDHTLPGLSSHQLMQNELPILPHREHNVQHFLAPGTLFPEEYFDFHEPLPIIGDKLERTASDQQTLSTNWSTSSLKKRLPGHSSKELKNVMRLMKSHSISNSSAATINGTGFTTSTARPTIQSVFSKACRSTDKAVVHLLADSLVIADWLKERQGLCIPGLPSHDMKSCWCAAIVEITSNCQNWIDPIWTTCPFEFLFYLHSEHQDDFGNTVLHFLAARGASMLTLINAIEQGADPNAKNTANQSFLHLFPGGLLHELTHTSNGLDYMVQKLQSFGLRLYDLDHLGRTPFHNIPSQTVGTYQQSLLQIAQKIKVPTWRDALGCIPTLSSLEAELEDLCEPETHISKQIRLVETARLAFEQPNIEDREGRNGMQCLAEASLNVVINEGEIQLKNHRKRKRNPSSSDPAASRLKLRYELVQKLLFLGVDINHFDKMGNTVLIAFVTHLPDGEDDKTLRLLFTHLILKGANIHHRNREGETALHVAVRLGRKVATTTLLQNGANVHARRSDGKGILSVGEKAYFDAQDIEDQQLYASIMACHALAFQYGAVPNPTIVQEWSKKEGFATYLRLQNSVVRKGVKNASNKKRKGK